VAAIARKNGRFALITARMIRIRANTLAAYEQGYKKYGFSHVLCLEKCPRWATPVPDAEVAGEKPWNFSLPKISGSG